MTRHCTGLPKCKLTANIARAYSWNNPCQAPHRWFLGLLFSLSISTAFSKYRANIVRTSTLTVVLVCETRHMWYLTQFRARGTSLRCRNAQANIARIPTLQRYPVYKTRHMWYLRNQLEGHTLHEPGRYDADIRDTKHVVFRES